MKKKIIIVMVNISMGELDWILPYLKYVSKKYYIFTYFRNQKVYDSLKNNKNLFQIWNSINDLTYIEKFTNNLTYKILLKIAKLVKLDDNLIIKLNNKISNLDNLEKIISKEIKVKDYKIELIFSCFGEINAMFDTIKKIDKNKRPLIVHFPVSPMPYVKKKIKILGRFPVKMQGDLFLLGRKSEITLFDKFISRNKIQVAGVPKFDESWVKELIDNNKEDDLKIDKKTLSKKFIITFAYESNFDIPNYSAKIQYLNQQLIDVMESVKSLKNAIIIFKLHPRKNSPKFIKILNEYKKDIWKISKMHPILLAKISNCYLAHPGSSTLIDAVRAGTPSLQLWKIKKDSDLKYREDTIYNVGLTKRANNKKELLQLFKKIKLSKKNNEYNRQKKTLLKVYPYLNSSTKRIDLIIKNEIERKNLNAKN